MKKFFFLFVFLLMATGFFFWPKKEIISVSLSNTRNPAALNTAPSAPAIQSSIQTTSQEIKTLLACYESEACDFPKTDPRIYGIAVGKALAKKLKNLRVENSDPGLETIARELVQVDDGFVQEEAIKTLALFPPSPENVRAMLQGLRYTTDPLLIEQAMKEWERYIGQPEEAAIQDFLAEFIAHGGQFSAEKASQLIFRFLNARTFSTFRAALNGMVPESTSAKNLKAALEEYERVQSGG